MRVSLPELIDEVLFDDVRYAWDDLEVDPENQYRRRNLVRATFAAIEGWAYVLKQQALEASESNPSMFSVAELTILREVDFRLEENGQVRERPARLQTVPNLRFAINAAMRMEGADVAAIKEWEKDDFVKEFWRNAWSVQNVRDRIVHPKSMDQMFITDDEVKNAELLFIYSIGLPAVVGVTNAIIQDIKNRVEGNPELAAMLQEVFTRIGMSEDRGTDAVKVFVK